MSSRWTIGTLPDCDLSVDRPGVSGRHCRLTLDGDGYILEDLRSEAGTFVNGVRIAGKVSVTVADSITLGPTVPLPWPPGLANSKRDNLRIGREPDNDFVINLPIVSGYHARVSWEGKPGQGVIEDLGSSNGTAIGSPDRKVSRSAFSASDTIFFGTHPVPGSELLARVDPSLVPTLLFQGTEMVVGRDPGCQRVIDLVTVSGRHARLTRPGGRILIEDLGSSNGTFVNGRPATGPTEVEAGDLIGLGRDSFRLAIGPTPSETRRIAPIQVAGMSRPAPTIPMDQAPALESGPGSGFAGRLGHPAALAILLIQAPILAIGIGLAFGTGASSALTSESSKAIASLLFWLGLAAVWFGLSDGVAGLLLDPNRPRERPGSVPPDGWPIRLAILGTLCLIQCGLALLIVAPIAGRNGLEFSSLGLLILSSLVGLATGLVIVLLSPRPSISWSALGVSFVALWLFGGGPWSLPRSTSMTRMVSNAAPSRWAFEGLLLSGSDRRPKPEAADRPDFAPSKDLAEAYFPAESDRMGPLADAMALGSMLIGLGIAGLVLVRASVPERGPSTTSIA